MLLCVTASARAQSAPSKSTLSKSVDSRLSQLLMRFPDSQESAERSNRYKVRQIVQLSQIPRIPKKYVVGIDSSR